MIWLLGCAPHLVLTGVVQQEDGDLVLRTMQGQHVQLAGQAEMDALDDLHDCTLTVSGPRLGNRLFVKDWQVVDSVYGPGVFVGVLREWGAVLAIEDRNTGSTLALASGSGEMLRSFVGETVLVVGPVVGDRQVQVVAFRVLTGEKKP